MAASPGADSKCAGRFNYCFIGGITGAEVIVKVVPNSLNVISNS